MVEARRHSPAPPIDPLNVVRRGVTDLHEEVDRRSGLGEQTIDDDAYASMIGALVAVVPSVESALARCAGGRHTIDRLAPLLLDDARNLGLPATRATDPIAVDRVDYDDPASWWGAAYVLEGSRLGAVVIARRLAAERPDLPHAYFAAASTGAGAAWAGFRSAFRDAVESSSIALDVAVASAAEVFGRILGALDRTTAGRRA